jgi:hypothetical protein
VNASITRDEVATTRADVATARADVAIVGAGAAGLAAAIFAAEAAPAARIVVLEGARTVGAKILISGGGRCNVTHHAVVPEDFNGTRPVVRNVLAAFDVPATIAWFAGLGVDLKREETGKLFPVSDKAATVLDALMARCRALGVDVRTAHRVLDLTTAPEDGDAPFTIQHAAGPLRARRVIMATGGRSLPKSGSDGTGWEIVGRLGHTVTDTHQALVPLVLMPGTPFAELHGISHPAELATFANGKRVDQRAGSLLWTHVGISGPVVMDASRHWVIAAAAGARPELRLSVFPGGDFTTVDQALTRIARERPRASVGRLIAERIPERAAATLVTVAGIEPALPNARLTREERRRLVHTLTALPLPVERPRGWNYAEVTAGGVPLGEIDYRTMASRVVPNLYLIGEMLDCDGRIGGFNFQWAWATGHLAGRAAARSL